MIQIGFKKIATKLIRLLNENWVAIKLIRYLKENWGSPFIVGFIVLLLSAAVSLLLNPLNTIFADSLALYSYYALVAGIFLQLASFLRYRGKSNNEVAV